MAKGNRKAQQELFDMFPPKMMRVCRQYLKRNDLAEEVMLNGFFKVFTKIDMYSGQGSFEGWIRRIMINESLTALRKENKLQYAAEDELENTLEYSDSFDSELTIEEIQKLIDSLPDGYKTVFVLYVVEGYKHSEIAELLQISEGTSKSQLSKARVMLQQMINKQNELNYGTQ